MSKWSQVRVPIVVHCAHDHCEESFSAHAEVDDMRSTVGALRHVEAPIGWKASVEWVGESAGLGCVSYGGKTIGYFCPAHTYMVEDP
jgi:hypothetical protein